MKNHEIMINKAEIEIQDFFFKFQFAIKWLKIHIF